MVKTIRNTFGDYIREKRVALGWSQAQLAEEAAIKDPNCKLKKQYISKIERGEVSVSADTLGLLFNAMKVKFNFDEY